MSRKKSAFLDQMANVRRAAQDATKKTFMQYLTDTCVITLNETFGIGKDRIQIFLEAWGNVYDQYFDALREVPETDYYREMLDKRLKMLYAVEHFEPFEERYQFLPEMKY